MSGNVDFIVLYQGRAGSSFLVRALDEHPDITARGEILNWLSHLIVPNEQIRPLRRIYEIAIRFAKREAHKRQLRAVRALYDARDRPTRVVGFKTKLRVVRDPDGLRSLLEERQVRTLVMDRENFVKKAVAHVYGKRLFEKTRDTHGDHAWNLFDEKDRLGPQHVSPEEFDRWLKKVCDSHERLQAYARTLRVPKLDVEYSDLLRDEQAWFGRIFDFLDVEPRRLESPVLRNEPADLRDALVNFDELKARYRGTPFEAMFDEIL